MIWTSGKTFFPPFSAHSEVEEEDRGKQILFPKNFCFIFSVWPCKVRLPDGNENSSRENALKRYFSMNFGSARKNL